MTRARKDRGMRTQLMVAQYFAARGWPNAQSTGAGRQGADIQNVPFDCEVKARKEFNPKAWLDQTRKRNATDGTGPLSFVVMRFNGQGEDAGKYGVMMDLDMLMRLMVNSGYVEGEVNRCTSCGQWIAGGGVCALCRVLDSRL